MRLISIGDLEGYTIQGVDGDLGIVKDLLFEDKTWAVRYVVADTVKWLPASRKVVLSPVAVDNPDKENAILPVKLTQEQIKQSPSLENHQPVSRQYEEKLFNYYGYAQYWAGPGLWGTYPEPAPLADGELKLDSDKNNQSTKAKLRSTQEVRRYRLSAKDKHIGHVSDFILNTKNWLIEYILINTRDWLPGGKNVLISTSCIESVNWLEHEVYVNLESEEIITGPEVKLDELSSGRPLNNHSIDALFCNIDR